MLDILTITGVIFVLIGLGFVLTRLGALVAADVASLGRFVVTLALPALIFRAVAFRPLAEIADAGYLLAMTCGSLAMLAGGYWWVRRVKGGGAAAATFAGMGMSCPNTGFVGYPVLLMAMPGVAPVALALNMLVENLVLIPLILALAEHARGGASGLGMARRIAARLIRNPIVLALIAGAAVSLSGVTLPVILARPVDILAQASAAVSLVVIGGTLAALPLRSLNAAVLPVVAGKLVLHPLAVGLCMILVALVGLEVADPDLAAAGVIMAAMPVMSIYPILARQSGEEGPAAMAMLVMTALSFLSISAVLALVLP